MPVAEHLTDTQTIARDHLFPSGRERGIYAVAEGGFAAGWFGWGQAAAPPWLVVPLAVGSAFGFLVAVTGTLVSVRARNRSTASAIAPSAGDTEPSWAWSSRWPASARRLWLRRASHLDGGVVTCRAPEATGSECRRRADIGDPEGHAGAAAGSPRRARTTSSSTTAAATMSAGSTVRARRTPRWSERTPSSSGAVPMATPTATMVLAMA